MNKYILDSFTMETMYALQAEMLQLTLNPLPCDYRKGLLVGDITIVDHSKEEDGTYYLCHFKGAANPVWLKWSFMLDDDVKKYWTRKINLIKQC